MSDIRHRELKIETSRVTAADRTIDAALSTTAPVERFFGFEVLDHGPEAVDLSRASPLPLLANHDSNSPIGSAENVRLEGGKLRARLRFAKTDRGDEFFTLVRDGHISGVSIGYAVDEAKETGRENDVPVFTITKWRLLEASIAPVPADIKAGIGRSILTIQRGKKMEHTTTKTRESEILALGDQYDKYITRDDTHNALRDGFSPEQFREFIMTKMESRHTSTADLHIGMSKREAQSFSIARAVAASISGDWSKAGLERSASDAVALMQGRPATGFYVPFDIFRRDFNVGTPTEAGNLVATEFRGDLFVDILRNNLVMGPLGVKILTGLSSDLDIPKKATGSTLGVATEIGALSETAPTTGKITLSPKRHGAFVEYSKQAIIQSSLAIEPLLRDDLLAGSAVLLQDQMINGSGAGANMLGLRNTSGIGSVVGGANGATIIWDHIVDLESACADVNAEPGTVSGYIINTKTRGKLKKTQKGTNLPFIWDNGATPLNDHRAGVTNAMPSNLTKGTSTTCSALLFGSDWSMAVLGIFGAPDVTVDPYTLATSGQVRITINVYADFGVRQSACFAEMEDALT